MGADTECRRRAAFLGPGPDVAPAVIARRACVQYRSGPKSPASVAYFARRGRLGSRRSVTSFRRGRGGLWPTVAPSGDRHRGVQHHVSRQRCGGDKRFGHGVGRMRILRAACRTVAKANEVLHMKRCPKHAPTRWESLALGFRPLHKSPWRSLQRLSVYVSVSSACTCCVRAPSRIQAWLNDHVEVCLYVFVFTRGVPNTRMSRVCVHRCVRMLLLLRRVFVSLA